MGSREEQGSERTGYIQVFVAGVLWGTIGLFVKEMDACGSTSALTSFLRMLFAFLILAVLTTVRYGVRAFRIDRKTMLACVLLGLFSQGIYNVFYSLAVVKTGVAVSSVLLGTAPVFTALTARLLFREMFTRRKAAALVINVVGCFLVVTGGRLSPEQLSLTGVLCGVAAGFLYSLTAVIGKIAGKRTNAFVISTYSYLFAALFLAVYVRPWKLQVSVSGQLLFIGFLYALIPTAITYLFYYAGVQKIRESSKVAVIASVEPVVATVLGVLIYHEKLGLMNLLGIGMVLGSIAVMNQRRTE